MVTHRTLGHSVLEEWRKAEELNPRPYLGVVVPVFEAGCRPHSDTFRSCNLAEGVGIEPTQLSVGADYGLASRRIATLPTFRA